MRSRYSFACLLVSFFLISPLFNPANAVGDEYLQLLDTLKKNKTITNEQYDDLIDAMDDQDANSEDKSELLITSKGGLEISTYDGNFSFELGGRVTIDIASYSQDVVELGNGTELRKASLSMEGILYSDWGYELDVDFSDADADIKDAYIEYRGNWPTRLKLGQFKEPFSLEELTSSKYITFMERALVNEFTGGHLIGVGAITRGEGWTAAAGLFGESFDDDAKNEGDEGGSLTARITYAPWHDDRKVFHLGLAVSHRTPDDDREIKFNVRPESHLTDVKYLNTGDITNVDRVNFFGFETALVRGSFSMQAEYIQARVKRIAIVDELEFEGWYLYASWFFTGESRIYKAKKGSFGRVKPTTDTGAWELALRYSQLDLNDADISGGEANQTTLGLNWYANPQTRFMVNYIRVDNDDDANDDGDVLGDDNPELLQLRVQIDF